MSLLRRSSRGSLLVALGCAGAAMLCGPSPASATGPEAVTLGAYSTSPSAATVEGLVNPESNPAEYDVEYADLDAGSSIVRQEAREWCEGKGSAGSREMTSPAHAPSLEPVMVALEGLHEGDEYCAQVVVAAGTSGDQWARFVAGAPTVLAQSASATGTTTAAVGLSIDAASQATSYVVEYALASSAWCRSGQIGGTHPEGVTAAASLAPLDGAFHEVSVGLAGLAPGSEYCAVGVATNHAGRGSGGPASFRTTALRTLLVAIGGTGSGAVSGPSISCPGACSSSFPLGAQVTLTANPSRGSAFAGWVGGCAGTSTCTVTLSADRSVGAVFTASSSAPPSGPPRQVHAPRVDTRTGEVQLEYEFPEAGSVETYGEVLQGATLASVPTSLTPSPTPVEGRRCKKGFVRRGRGA